MARVPSGLPGAEPPRVLAAGRSMWLVVSEVSGRAYGSASIDRGLGDLEWVAPRAVAHEVVVEYFARRFDVVPMKLFTIFRTGERALEHVASRRDLPAIFTRIGGAAEWTVRLQRSVVDESKTAGHRRRPAATRRSPVVGSGVEFLRRKRSQRDEERSAAERTQAFVRRAYAALARVARADLQKDTAVPGATVLLDAVFLVSRARLAKFEAEVRRVGRAAGDVGVELALSGPWPAYHFANEASSGAPGGGG